jgi:hypothetical protein
MAAVLVENLDGSGHAIEDIDLSASIHLNVPDLPERAWATIDIAPDHRESLELHGPRRLADVDAASGNEDGSET